MWAMATTPNAMLASDAVLTSEVAIDEQPAPLTGFHLLPRAGQVYVAAVILFGVVTFAAHIPTALPQPWLFAALVLWTCVTSLWKVALPVGKVTGSTLSV